MPSEWRNAVLRDRIDIQHKVPEGVTFKIASTQDELEQSFRILHDAYVKVGLMKPNPSGLRISIYHALPTSIVLTAQKDGKVLGTVTIIRDSKLGLPSEKILNLDNLRKPGLQIAEISALAIRPGSRGRLFFPLLKYLYEIATRQLRIDMFVISVHSDWYFFYEGLLCFQRIENRVFTNYAFANNVPVIGEYLDLKEAYFRFAEYYAHLPLKQNVFAYFCNHTIAEFVRPESPYYSIINSTMTIETLDYFFNQKTEVFKNMTLEERRSLNRIYRDVGFDALFSKSVGIAHIDSIFDRKHLRIPSCLNGLVMTNDGNFTPITIVEVSRSGLKGIFTDTTFDGRLAFYAKVQVGDYDIAELKLAPAWAEKPAIGFQVTQACKNWNAFIDFCEFKLTALATKAA
jgi:hypothetical protein